MRRGLTLRTARAAVALAVATVAGTAAMMAQAPAARADVGDVVVAQAAADGKVVCATDYGVFNVHAVKVVTGRVCGGVTEVRVLNETNLPITLHILGGTKVVDKFGGAVVAVGGVETIAPLQYSLEIPAGW